MKIESENRGPRRAWHGAQRRLFLSMAAALLVACGGGGGDVGAPSPGPTPNPPPPAPPPATVTARVAAGNGFSVALKTNGSVFAWGDQQVGQLGNDIISGSSQRTPQQALGLANARQVVAGEFHALALRGDGAVFAWGSNADGKLGLGTVGGLFPRPQQIGSLANITAIATGLEHSLALRSDGVVLAWGRNTAGQLGVGDLVDRASPVAIGGLTGVTAIAAGGFHSFAIRNDGTVWAWGFNGNGELGLSNSTNRSTPTQVTTLNGRGITQIAAGGAHTLARAADGSVWSWGFSGQGQTGRVAAVGSSFTTFLTPGQVPGLTGVAQVAAGDAHSIARLASGAVRTWGDAASGRLGNNTSGTTQSTFVPQTVALTGVTDVAAGFNHTLALLQDGRVACFGSNFLAQCGRIEIVDFDEPLEVGPGFRVNQ
jgi:alpha-tubulin suppressor-like RCC1 family protein